MDEGTLKDINPLMSSLVVIFVRGGEAILYVLNLVRNRSSLGRYVFGSEISYNKAPPRLPGLGC